MTLHRVGLDLAWLHEFLRSVAVVASCFLLSLVFVNGAASVRAAEMNSPLPNEIKAGPIWNEGDAQKKCPNVCAQASLPWSGLWRTTVWRTMSVCSCGGSAQAVTPSGAGTSCSASANAACGGCSVACPPGQQALCKEGEDHGVTSPLCWTKAKCECQ